MNSNSSSKSLAMMFLLGAFLVGGVLGFFGGRMRPNGRPFTESAMRDELSHKLNLSPTQRLALDSAYDWRYARQEEIMQPIRPQIQAMRDSAASMFMTHLDSVQAVQYQAIRDSSAARNRMRNMPDSARGAQGERR